MIARHEAERARATILTPVPNPEAHGLVEADASSRVLRFIEKPRPEQLTHGCPKRTHYADHVSLRA